MARRDCGCSFRFNWRRYIGACIYLSHKLGGVIMFLTISYKGYFIHIKNNNGVESIEVQGLKPWLIRPVKSLRAAKIFITKQLKAA
jgi:hypothetical protein